jgi:two-component system nitrate/nitrite response regulator NarL
MPTKISLAILEDHQSIIDGYRYRLRHNTEIEVVATAQTADRLEPMLQQQEIDVLLMDVNVPVSPSNPNPYPILEIIPRLRRTYPSLTILVISMHKQPELVQAVVRAGARGYIYKNDYGTIQNLDLVILQAVNGTLLLSEEIKAALSPQKIGNPHLTPRQIEILAILVAEPGLTTKAVAQRLHISHSTVRNLLSKAYGRLGVQNLTAAVSKMRELGILVQPGSHMAFSSEIVPPLK